MNVLSRFRGESVRPQLCHRRLSVLFVWWQEVPVGCVQRACSSLFWP